ncbi:PE family protein [Mycobacterium marinum]|uniref:PE family protein n=1 Tax=Mycobacterium marinum TaxID=1781 RepID=UPI000E3EB96B|nr:PE family protein [Mycobacterium marinum]MDC9005932.1 PE family protein [Mycobacterium marinum]RFZ51519.1 PE family protein [Mycobacterium marinum]
MSDVMVAPELVAAAANDYAKIGVLLGEAHAAAAASTVELLPAAADEVSAGIAHLFSEHAEDYQKVASQAAAFHDRFAAQVNASAGGYASAEAANAVSLHALFDNPHLVVVAAGTVANALSGLSAGMKSAWDLLWRYGGQYVATALAQVASSALFLLLIAFVGLYSLVNGRPYVFI